MALWISTTYLPTYFTLTNIIKGVKYRMSIAGKSEHFFSIFRSAIYSVWCVFHIYHNYEGESVGGGVDHKEEDNEGSDADEVEEEGENNGGRGGSAGVVVAGVLLPLIYTTSSCHHSCGSTPGLEKKV